MAHQWLDFKHIKETVNLEDLLCHYGLRDRMRSKGDQLTGFCPLPGHTGSRKKSPSFSVNTEKNIWQCFSCQKGGNVLDFVQAMEQAPTIRAAAGFIVQHFPTAAIEKPDDSESETVPPDTPVTSPEPDPPSENPPLTFQLKNLDHKHPYLNQRGLTAQTIDTFGVGYCSKGLMKNRVVIPIHNRLGQLIAYAGRAIAEVDEQDGKYKLPTGFRKEVELFNLHRARTIDDSNHLIVVEGFFDVMRLWECGYQNAVAIMGTYLSDEQANLLLRNVGSRGRLTLLFDGDIAGHRCSIDALRRLVLRVHVRMIRLPDGLQPDDLSSQELRILLDN